MTNLNNRKGGPKKRRKRYHRIPKLWHRENDVFYITWTENGKTKMRSLKTTDIVEAENELRKFRLHDHTESFTENRDLTFHQAADDWFEDRCLDIGSRTKADYACVIRKFRAYFPAQQLAKHITSSQCDKYRVSQLKKGLAPYSVRKQLVVLKAIFSRLVDLEVIGRNPMAGVKVKGKAGVRPEMPEYLSFLKSQGNAPLSAGALDEVEK